MALSHFKGSLASQYDREMKQCGRVGHPLAEVQQNNENMDRQRHFLVSTNCYYGYQPLIVEGSRPRDEGMEIGDCEMTPLPTPASRKRTFDDVNGRQYKRFRTEGRLRTRIVIGKKPNAKIRGKIKFS